MKRPTLAADGSATGQVTTFLVAGVMFLGAVGTVLVATRDSSHASSPDRGAAEANQQQQANRLADLLVGSQGIGWAAGADGLGRLGLRAANGSGLQESSLDALRGALFAPAANGKLDYDEARASLGLAGAQQFHLRMAPVGMDAVYDASSSGIRTAYVGDWQSLASVTVTLGSSLAMQDAAQAAINTTMFGLTANERAALRSLGLAYSDQVFISALAPSVLVDQPFPLPDLPLLTVLNVPLLEGDVYPDAKGYLDANLPGRLARYDLLVVGSGVDQSSLTSAGVKFAVRDWVLAGGTLVVLGSEKMNYQWLEPLFSAGVRTANGVASAPDPSHPLLLEPHELDWPSYDSHGRGWDIKGQDAAGFSGVVVQDGHHVLSVSNDGALGKGRVILTTYLPREVAATRGLGEAQNLLENIVLFIDRTKLYLEYGPERPHGVPVAVAVRQSDLYDPALGQVPVRLEVQFWGD